MNTLPKLYHYCIIVLEISSLLMGLYGIALLIKPSFMLSSMETYAGIQVKSFPSLLEKYLLMLIKLLGCFNVIASLGGLVGAAGYRKNQSSRNIFLLFVCVLLGYGSCVAFDLVTGITGLIEIIEIVFFGISLVAYMLISVFHYEK